MKMEQKKNTTESSTSLNQVAPETTTIKSPTETIPGQESTPLLPLVNGTSGSVNSTSNTSPSAYAPTPLNAPVQPIVGDNLPSKLYLSELYTPKQVVNPDLQQKYNEEKIKNDLLNRKWTDSFSEPKQNVLARNIEDNIHVISSQWNEAKQASDNNKQNIQNLKDKLNDPNTPPDQVPFLESQYNKSILDDSQTDEALVQMKQHATNLQQAKATMLKINQTAEDLAYNSESHIGQGVGAFVSSAWNNAIPSTISGIGDLIQSAGQIADVTIGSGGMMNDTKKSLSEQAKKIEDPDKRLKAFNAINDLGKNTTALTDNIGGLITDMGKSITLNQENYDLDKHKVAAFTGGLVGSVASVAIPTGALGLAAKGAKVAAATVFGAQGANAAWDEMESVGVKNKTDKALFTVGMGAVNGAVTAIGLHKVIDGAFGNNLVNEVMKEAATKIATDNITGTAILDVVSQTLKDKSVDIAKHIGENALKSSLEGGAFGLATGVADVAGKEIYNKAAGKDVFTDESGKGVNILSKESGMSILKSGAEMALGAGLIGTLVGGTGNKNAEKSYYDKVIQLNQDPEALHKFTETLDAQFKAGDLTEEEHDNIINNIKSITETNSKIPPTVTDKGKRIKAINLITERNNIESENIAIAEQMTKLDPSMSGELQDKITENTQKITDINASLDAISKGEPEPKKQKEDDTKNEGGVQSDLGTGKEPVSTEPNESASAPETSNSGVVQESPEEAETKVKQLAKDKNIELTDDEVGDISTIYLDSQDSDNPLSVSQAIDFHESEKGSKPTEFTVPDEEPPVEEETKSEPVKNKVVTSIAKHIGNLINSITGKKSQTTILNDSEFKKKLAESEDVQSHFIPSEPKEIKPGNKLFSESAPEIKTLADKYKKDNNIQEPSGNKIYNIDEENSKKIADEFQSMKHNPEDLKTKKAYKAMVSETLSQYKTLKDAGYSFEIYDDKGEPYANSTDMLKDLKDNKHLFVLSTENEFGKEGITKEQRDENPLLNDSKEKDINDKPLLNNDIFRGVHDAFGHGERGNSFGPKGEENAWDVHARMYSPLARRAMTTETRGQNSWVNFGEHLRNEDGTMKKMNKEKPVFAEQKIGLLPEWVSDIKTENNEDLISKTPKVKKMTEDGKGNYVFYHGSEKDLTKKGIDPTKFGKNTHLTGRDENPLAHASFYYTEPNVSEPGIGNYTHAVKIPKNEVYPFNEDPLHLYDEAKKRFETEHPGIAFDFNKQVAWVSTVAAEKGYKMTVADWQSKGGKKLLRAQSPELLKPEIVSKPKKGALNQIVENENNQFKSNRGNRTVYHTSNGDVLGFVDKDGNVFLNEKHINPETPFHEVAGHILMDWYEKERPDIHDAGIKKIQGSTYLDDVKSNPKYQEEANNLPEEEQERYYEKEALATAIGDEGGKFITESQKESFIGWLKEFWNTVKQHFGLEKMTSEELQNMTLKEFSQKVAARILDKSTDEKPIAEENTNPVAEEKVHSVWDTMLSGVKDESLKEGIKSQGIKYLVNKEAITESTAQDILDAAVKGERVSDVEKLVLDKTNGMSPVTRGVLSSLLGKHYFDMAETSKNSFEKQQHYNDFYKYTDIAASMATEGGQIGNLVGKVIKKLYANNPEMVVAKVEKLMNEQNENKMPDADNLYKSIKEILESQEGQAAITEEISKKSERLFGKETQDKIVNFFDKAKVNTTGKMFDASIGIPIAIYNGSIETMKQASLLGAKVIDIIDEGVRYVKEKHTDDWDESAFRKEWTKKFEDSGIKFGKGKKILGLLDSVEKKAGKLKPEKQRQFLSDVSHEVANEGGLTEERFKNLYAKALGLPTMTPELIAHIKELSKTIQDGESAEKKYLRSLDDIIEAEAKGEPIDDLIKIKNSALKSAIAASLNAKIANQKLSNLFKGNKKLADTLIGMMQLGALTPLSIIKNITAMPAELAFRALSGQITGALDTLISGVASIGLAPESWKDRTVKPIARAKGAFFSHPDSFKHFYDTLIHGSLADDYTNREYKNNITPVDAFKNIVQGKTRGDMSALSANIVEALPTGYMAAAFGRALSAPDVFFRTIGQTAKAYELGRLQGLDGAALEKFVYDPPSDVIDKIHAEGDKITFQQDTKLSKAISNFKLFKLDASEDNGAVKKFILGALRVVSKTQGLYIKTPINVLVSTFRMISPEYSLVKAAYHLSEGNKEGFAKSIADAAVSYAFRYVIMSVFKKGMMTPPADYNDKSGKMEQNPDIKHSGKFNMSAYTRMMTGGDWKEQNSDVWVDYAKWTGGLGIAMGAYANMLQGMKKEDMNIFSMSKGVTWASIGSVFQQTMDLSFMSTTAQLMDAMRDKGDKRGFLSKWITSGVGTLETPVLPNTVGTLSKASQTTKKETKDKDSLWNTIKNDFKNRSFQGQELPSKITLWGDPVKTSQHGENAYMNYMFNVVAPENPDENSLSYKVMELYRKTGDEKVIPSQPMNQLSIGGKKVPLSPKQYEQLQKYVGSVRKKLATDYVNEDEYKTSTDAEKIRMLSKIYADAHKTGTEMFINSDNQMTNIKNQSTGISPITGVKYGKPKAYVPKINHHKVK